MKRSANATAICAPSGEFLSLALGTLPAQAEDVWAMACRRIGVKHADLLRQQGYVCCLVELQILDEEQISRPRLIDDALEAVRQLLKSGADIVRIQDLTVASVHISAAANDDVLPEFTAPFFCAESNCDIELFFRLVDRSDSAATYEVRLHEANAAPPLSQQMAGSARQLTTRNQRQSG